jgi:hypothetical protein
VGAPKGRLLLISQHRLRCCTDDYCARRHACQTVTPTRVAVANTLNIERRALNTQGLLQRPQLLARLRAGLKMGPAVASKSTYFDLENPVDLARLSEPMTALESLRGLIVIDEVQRHPNLFPILRVLLDRKPVRARFLILGSASPELPRQSSETKDLELHRLLVVYPGSTRYTLRSKVEGRRILWRARKQCVWFSCSGSQRMSVVTEFSMKHSSCAL